MTNDSSKSTRTFVRYGRAGARVGLWVLTVFLLGWVVGTKWASIKTVVARGPDRFFSIAAIALCLSGLFLTFARWFLLARAVEMRFGLRDAIRLGFIGHAIDSIIPGQIGGDVFKAASLFRTHSGKSRIVSSIVLDRALGLAGLFLVTSLAGAWCWRGASLPILWLISIVWGSTLAGCLILTLALSPSPTALLVRIVPSTGYISAILTELQSAGIAYRRRKLHVVSALVMAIASHSLYALSFYAVFRALVPVAPRLTQTLLISPLALFTMAAPLPLGALGFSEKVSDELFQLVDHPDGAVIMLGFRVVGLSVSCISALVFLWNATNASAIHAGEPVS